MRIWILVKAPGRLKEPLARREWEIPAGIGNLRELVTALVEASLAAFAARPQDLPLTEAEMEEMKALGKFAFGFRCNEERPDRDRAVEAALLALEDGLVRIYRNGEALEDPDAPLKLDEGDELLLLRLSFLAGRLW